MEIRGNYLAQGELKVGYSHRIVSVWIFTRPFWISRVELRTGFGLFAVVKVQESCAQGLLFSRGYSYRFACIFVLRFCRCLLS